MKNSSWNLNSRKNYCKEIESYDWDVVVIGGGISGAGTLLSSSFHGLKTLLLEQKDFAWGTSSRSSKMVHGGLRYMAKGNYRLTKESVVERQHLLSKLSGLVEPLSFIMPHYKMKWPPAFLFRILLRIYDFFAKTKNTKFYSHHDLLQILPGLKNIKLKSGSKYYDAATTDSRLVMRILLEAKTLGAYSANYCEVQGVQKNESGYLITAFDSILNKKVIITAKTVVNCTGVWSEKLGLSISNKYHIRPLRGSHIIIPNTKLVLSSVVLVMHPQDKRPVFIFPWHGCVVVGTTDLDHQKDLNIEPSITKEEVDYLLDLVNHYFPSLKIIKDDIISTWSGVRPVISSGGNKKPSSETREHEIWENKDGIISVAGGKLTTFSVIAYELIKKINEKLKFKAPELIVKDIPYSSWDCILPKNIPNTTLSNTQLRRIQGLYGSYTSNFLSRMNAEDLKLISNTQHIFGELKWALLEEAVIHLDDLLLRRTQLGLLLPEGGKELFVYLKDLCMKTLKWDQEDWDNELKRYLSIWHNHYSIIA